MTEFILKITPNCSQRFFTRRTCRICEWLRCPFVRPTRWLHSSSNESHEIARMSKCLAKRSNHFSLIKLPFETILVAIWHSTLAKRVNSPTYSPCSMRKGSPPEKLIFFVPACWRSFRPVELRPTVNDLWWSRCESRTGNDNCTLESDDNSRSVGPEPLSGKMLRVWAKVEGEARRTTSLEEVSHHWKFVSLIAEWRQTVWVKMLNVSADIYVVEVKTLNVRTPWNHIQSNGWKCYLMKEKRKRKGWVEAAALRALQREKRMTNVHRWFIDSFIDHR